MKTFPELKQEFVDKCKAASACEPEFKRLLKAETPAEILEIVSDNIGWCLNSNVLTNEWIHSFPADVVLASGIANTGKENTGFVNSGNRNSGNWNSGDRNSGNWNSGDRNSGDSNSGYRNSGNSNSGDRNSGNWNSGDRNSGDSNSGYRNSGAFCTEKNPPLILFNKVSSMTVKEWENHPVCNLMYSIDPTIWVPMNMMSDEEKAAHPKFETTEGYLKTIPIKDAWANFWHNQSDENKALFTSLENFDAAIFEEITGIKL